MKKIGIFTVILLFISSVSAQKRDFKTVIDIESSAVKSQGHTGTCWSFSTSSFLESEIYKKSGKHIDISEMYTVRNTYPTKAWNYVMRQGKTQFSEGGLSHDVINSIKKYGLVPESFFQDVKIDGTYNHSKIVPQLKKVLDAYIKNDKDSSFPNWKKAIDTILDKEIGVCPKQFNYEGVTYTPISFLKYLNIDPTDYISVTSFAHQPYYTSFILNIPDNFSNGSFYNVPLEDFTKIVDEALKKGYTLALDADVSEKTFSAKYGIAFVPENDTDKEKGLTEFVAEKTITPELRQQEFENYNTTDDHLMHIVGMVKDQKGNEYYKVKNSWGGNSNRIGNNGYIYMSKAFFKLKAISVLFNKNGLSEELKKKLLK